MATTPKGSAPSSVSSSKGLSFDEFVQMSVSAAAQATKSLPGGPHPIWIGLIIRPDFNNPQVIGGGGGQAKQ